MGLYDTIRAPCPQCGTVSEFQSKSGECLCETFSLEDCPMDVLRGANRHSPNTCEKCGTLFSIDISERRTFSTSELQARCDAAEKFMFETLEALDKPLNLHQRAAFDRWKKIKHGK